MSALAELRHLQPLFASISPDFDKLSSRLRDGFRKLGANILNIAYKRTVFDPEIKKHGEDDVGDNFDLYQETAEKLYILRPALRASTYEPLVGNIPAYHMK